VPPKRAAARPPRKPIDEQRPPALWGTFPLTELVALFGLALVVAGFFFVEGSRGTQLLATGLVIGSLAGLELSVREHLAGYRSHSLLLAGAAGVASMLGLYYLAGLPAPLSLVAGGAVFALGFWGLASLFQRRAGQMIKLR
jgi:hypothetical protein